VVLYVAAHAQTQEAFFEARKIYMPQSTDGLGSTMVLGPDTKLGLIRDTSIQPFGSREEVFEIPVPAEGGEVSVHVDLSYQPRPGDVIPVHSVVRKVALR